LLRPAVFKLCNASMRRSKLTGIHPIQ
jgi:hypothetical protein